MSLLPMVLTAIALVGLDQTIVQAQGGTIAGQVVAEQSLRPLPGAQVQVEGTQRGTLTDASGRFVIPGVPGTQATVRVVMIGYRPVTRVVSVGDTNVRIALAESAVELDEVVVTGTAGGQQRRAIGNVVATVRAADVVETAPVPNVQALINARAPGVVIMPGTGMVGSGSRIRIRGSSSISLSNEPLIYVDGVRVDNAQATGAGNVLGAAGSRSPQGFGSNVISRWNDFNPDDIESIEVIKGPAAATLYGTEASNGVIHIITKRGQEGRPSFNFTMRQGANWFANAENRVWTNYWRNPTTGQVESLNLVQAERERGTPIWTTGHLQNYSLNLSGGTPGVRYYLGGDFDNEQGVEPTNALRRIGGRANVTVLPLDNLDITASLGYISSRTDLSIEAGRGGVTWGAYYSTPQHLNHNLPPNAPPHRGYRSWTSEAYWNITRDWQEVGRFTGSLQVNHRPTGWFSQRLNVGTDEAREGNHQLTERSELLAIWSPASVGEKYVLQRDASYNTFDYSGTVNLNLNPSFSSSTSFGAQYYRRFTRWMSAEGADFSLPGLRVIGAAGGARTSSEDYLENVTVGVFAQQQFGWQNRLFLTAAIRADDNSAFGENFDLVYYPKASATWVVSEEPFWRIPMVNTLRLRAAYGQSGQQPQDFAALRIFGAETGPGGTATVTPRNLGNPDLGPERGEELEFGFDAGFLQDRVGVEFTVYNQRTRDAILDRDAPPSLGFPGRQFVNIGEVRNQGVELMLRGQPLLSPRAGLDLTFSVATNRSEVTDMGDLPSIVLDAVRGVEHRVGQPMGGWYHRRIVSAEMNPDGTVNRASVMCDDGQGGTLPCWTGTAMTTVNPAVPRVFLGQSNPRFEGAFTSTLALWQRLRLYAMVDYKTGHVKYDANEWLRCASNQICYENMYPLEADPVKMAGYQGGNNFGASYIHDASFAKLREVSATFTLPTRYAAMAGASRAALTLAGRNLYTWTRWPGLEPEAMYLGGARGGFVSLEQNNLPQLTQFVTTVNITF